MAVLAVGLSGDRMSTWSVSSESDELQLTDSINMNTPIHYLSCGLQSFAITSMCKQESVLYIDTAPHNHLNTQRCRHRLIIIYS